MAMVRTFKLPLFLLPLLSLLLQLPCAAAQSGTPASPSSSPPTDWRQSFGALPVQDGGRVMPLDTFARQLAVQLTGRSSWSNGKGPEAFSGKQPVELVADLLFSGSTTWRKPLVVVEID